MNPYRPSGARHILSRTALPAFLLLLAAGVQVVLVKLLEPALGVAPAIVLSLFLVSALSFAARFNRKVRDRLRQVVCRHEYGYHELEEKVRERTRELDEAKKSAEAANKAKSEFLSNITHELRTPLNSIIGFSDVMRSGTTGPLTGEQEACLKDIWESGRHLLRIINNVLDLSKIEAGMMELERDEFYLHELLEGSLHLFRERARRQRIILHSEIGRELDMVTADKTKIKQIVLNLLANAVKFTPEGGDVGIRASAGKSEVRVDVWDTGIGISTEDCGKLFRPFLQLDHALTKKYEGTGLGLHVSRKLVELHGGRLWVESEPGKGSRFSFTIPFSCAVAPGLGQS